MKSIRYLFFLLTTASGAHAGCLTLTCTPAKTVACDDTTWTFDPPSVADNCDFRAGNAYTLTVLSTVTSGICPHW